MSNSVTGAERAALIRNRLDSDGHVRITVLAQELGVSEMTIRRDLQELETLGVARRTRGGAVVVGPGPLPFEQRHRHRAHAKARIAAKLIDLVPDTGAIGIDASSTLLRLARKLPGARNLTVLTNSLESFAALQRQPGITAQLTGGQHEPLTGSLVGPLAIRTANELLLERLFVSASAVDPALGSSESSLAEAAVKRAMARVADEIVLAVDSSKLGSRAVARSLAWDQIAILVTELQPDDSFLRPYRSLVKLL